MQQRVCRSDEINANIIENIEKKAALVASNADESIIAAYSRRISDLEQE